MNLRNYIRDLSALSVAATMAATAASAQSERVSLPFDPFGQVPYSTTVATNGIFTAFGNPTANTGDGAVYVLDSFGDKDANPTTLTFLTPDIDYDVALGTSLAMSKPTATLPAILVIGAPGFDANKTDIGEEGAAFVYELAWNNTQTQVNATLVAQIAPPSSGLGRFGTSVDIDDSGTIVVGAPGSVNGSDPESAWVYVVSGSAGALTVGPGTQISSPGAADIEFGHSVAVDGSTLAVGAPEAGVFPEPGEVWVYSVVPSPVGPSVIGATPVLIPNPNPANGFGKWDFGLSLDVTSVGPMSSTGQNGMIFVGAPAESGGAQTGRGNVTVFDTAGAMLIELFANPSSTLPLFRDNYGTSLAVDANSARDEIVIAIGDTDHQNSYGHGAHFSWKVYGASTATPDFVNTGWAPKGHSDVAIAISTALDSTIGSLPYPQVLAACGNGDCVASWPSPIGTNYGGPAFLNSTGSSAVMLCIGSTDVARNDLQLIGYNVPSGKSAYFLNGTAQTWLIPPGSQGALVVAGDIGRWTSLVQTTTDAGFMAIRADLTSWPTPLGATVVTPGETWNLQGWFRDNNPISTSNFTDGVQITFQ